MMMLSVREPGSQMCMSKGSFSWGTHQEDNIGVLVEGSGHTDSLPLTTRQVDTLSPKQRKRSCFQPFRFSLCTWSSMRRWNHPQTSVRVLRKYSPNILSWMEKGSF